MARGDADRVCLGRPRYRRDRGFLAVFSGMRYPTLAVITAAVADPASASEHRSGEVTWEFQRQHPCPSTGQTKGACPGYVMDHVVPLGCGGPRCCGKHAMADHRCSEGKGSLGKKKLWCAGVHHHARGISLAASSRAIALLRNQKFADSSLEGTGSELLVPRREARDFRSIPEQLCADDLNRSRR